VKPIFPPELTRVSGRRYIAHLADSLVLGVVFVVVAVPAGIVSDILLGIVFAAWVTVAPVGYFVVTQRGTGRSPGKRLVGIQVVDAAGEPPTTNALLKRSVPLIVEYLLVLAWFSMMASSYRQRFGDRWAGTYVVLS
jgi:uncharacterized RDD family membrane protein YckC